MAQLLYTVYGVIGLLGIVYGGTGEHVDQLTPEGAAIGLKAWYLCEVLYAPLSALVRTSVAVFLLKIAAAKTHRIIIYVNLAVIWILSIVYFFLMLLQCDPPSFFWEQVLGAPGHCLDPRVVPDATYAHSAIGAVCDWSLALLPIWMLWNVKLNVRTKVTIGILLSMGGVLVDLPHLRPPGESRVTDIIAGLEWHSSFAYPTSKSSRFLLTFSSRPCKPPMSRLTYVLSIADKLSATSPSGPSWSRPSAS